MGVPRRQEKPSGRRVERPPSELIGLLRRTHALLEQKDIPAREGTLEALFEGLKGHEVVTARHVFCSFALENLLRHATDEQRGEFFKSLLAKEKDLETLLIDRYASHIVDVLCTLTSEADGAAPPLADLVVSLSDTIARSEGLRRAVVYDRYGAHVVQRLVATLAGQQPPPAGAGSRQGPSRRAVFPPFRGALERLGAAILGEGADMVTHSCATLAVRAVLLALAPSPGELLSAAGPLLGWEGLGTGAVAPEAAVERLLTWSKDANGAATMETLLRAMPAEAVESLYTNGLRTHVRALAVHRSGNHVVQRLLEFARGEPLCALLVGELGEAPADLVGSGCAGVIWKLLEACARNNAKEKQAIKVLTTALAPAAANPRLLPLAVLSLRPDLATSALHEAQLPTVTALGARIAQSWLAMGPPLAAQLVQGFQALSPAAFADLACDRSASHVVQALFTAKGTTREARARLGAKFKSFVSRLARDKCGSHCVEACYFAVDVSDKEWLLKELVAGEQAVQGSQHGAKVLRKLRVADFKRREANFLESAAQEDNRRAMFDDILTDGYREAQGPGQSEGAAQETPAARAKGKRPRAGDDNGWDPADAHARARAKSLGGSALDRVQDQLGPAEPAGQWTGAREPVAGVAKGELATAFAFIGEALGASASDKRAKKQRRKQADGGAVGSRGPSKRRFSMS